MSFLSKIFGYAPKKERQGISLSVKDYWEVSGIKDFPSFLRSLRDLIPNDSVLYLEGGDTPKKLRSYLEERATQNICKVEMGTIWPHPDIFHIGATIDNLEDLAGLIQNYVSPQVAVHLHVYKEGKMLLQWYDAFSGPMFVSKEIPEDSIKDFCDILNVKYIHKD